MATPRWNFRPSLRDMPPRRVSAAEPVACGSASDSLQSLDGQELSLRYLQHQTLHNNSWVTVSTSPDLNVERDDFDEATAPCTTTDRACVPLFAGSKLTSMPECSLQLNEYSEPSLLALCSSSILNEHHSTVSLDRMPLEAPWFENSSRNLGQQMYQEPVQSVTRNEHPSSLRDRQASESRHDRMAVGRKLPSALRLVGRTVSDVSTRRRKSVRGSGKCRGALFYHEGKDVSKTREPFSREGASSPLHGKRKGAQKDEKPPLPDASRNVTITIDSSLPRSAQALSLEESASVQKMKKRSTSLWTAACFER